MTLHPRTMALAVSLALHGAAFLALHRFFTDRIFPGPEEAMTLVSVQLTSISTADDPKPLAAVAAPAPAPVQQSEFAVLSDTLRSPVKLVPKRPAPAPVAKPQPVPAKGGSLPVRQAGASGGKPATVRGEQLLSDPQRGRVFSGYFSSIKEKIHRTVKSRYLSDTLGEGTVTLVFVLNADGSLDTVSVVEAQSTKDNSMRRFAIQCLREASPFVSFPVGLDVKKISFNVAVAFEET